MIDLILDPNIAYLFLVGGAMLAMMALLTPGTGVLEVSSLLAFAVAAWQVYNLPINIWAMVLLLVGVFPFLLAVRKSGNMLYLVVTIGALVIGSAYLFENEAGGWAPAVNPILALVTSTVSGWFIWLLTVKTLEAHRVLPTHDLSPLIGAVGVAKTAITEEGGTVFVQMEDWTAQSAEPIAAGGKVQVTGREGLILLVQVVE